MFQRFLLVVYWLSVFFVGLGLYSYFNETNTNHDPTGLLVGLFLALIGFIICFIGSGQFLLPPKGRDT